MQMSLLTLHHTKLVSVFILFFPVAVQLPGCAVVGNKFLLQRVQMRPVRLPTPRVRIVQLSVESGVGMSQDFVHSFKLNLFGAVHPPAR